MTINVFERNYQNGLHHFNHSFFVLSLSWAKERLPVHVQPGAVPGVLLDLRQLDGSALHPGSRFACLFVWSLNISTCCTTNAAQANPAHTVAQNERWAFVCLMEICAAGICFANDGAVECDAVCCLIIPAYVFPSADSFYDTFHTTADMMYFCQMMAVLEVVNPLLGLVKTGFFPAMIQVI